MAELMVSARTTTGAPLDSVGVHVVPFTERRGDFGTMRVMLDGQGTGRISIERFSARVGVGLSENDTVRFVVTAEALKEALADGNGGQPVIKKDTVLLTLRPIGQPPGVDSLTFVFEAASM